MLLTHPMKHVSTRLQTMWMGMLLNDGRHPHTNHTIVPPSVLEYVTLGRTVMEGSTDFPEMVGRLSHVLQLRELTPKTLC